MAKKQQKGHKANAYKGSTKLKIGITSGIVAGAMIFSLAGYGIKSWMSRNTEIEDPYDKIPSQSDTIATEPSIKEPENYGEPDLGETLPELKDPIPSLDPEETIDELGVDFAEVIALLTQSVRTYIGSVTGVTPDNLNITAVNSISPDVSKGTVSILTQFKNGTKYSNCIVTINNADSSLAIYNLPADATAEEVILATKDVLTQQNTHTTADVKRYVKLSNENEVIKAMLTSRLNELNALNSTETSVQDEIAHIQENLKDLTKVRLSLLINKRNEQENPEIQPFTVTIHCGKYTYSMDMSLEMTKFLSGSAMDSEIEEFLDNNIDQFKVNSQYSSVINQVLHIISTTSNNQEKTEESTNEKTEEKSTETQVAK